jgi:putative DNA primase/helicase
MYRMGGFTGILFALGAGLAAIDIDDCRDAQTGIIEPWAVTLAGKLASFTEVSPSGRGLHILIRGRLPKGINATIDGHRIEAYSDKRFLCMSGWAVSL